MIWRHIIMHIIRWNSTIVSGICLPTLLDSFFWEIFLSCLCCFTLSLACLSFSLIAFLAERQTTSLKCLFGEELVISFHSLGPHSLPMLCYRPALMQQCSHNPDCERLKTPLLAVYGSYTLRGKDYWERKKAGGHKKHESHGYNMGITWA